MGIIYYLLWVVISQEVSMPGVSSEYTENFSYGLIWDTRSKTQDQNGRSHSPNPPTLPVSSLKRLVSNVNSQTPVLESVSEFNSRRITRELLPTYQGTVV